MPARLSRAGAACLVAGLALAAAGLASAAAGQGLTTSSVEGRVTDEEGRPLADVAVELLHAPSGTGHAAVTGPDGRFHLPNLRPGGPYVLTVSRLGFAEERREALRLPLGETVRLQVVLSPQAVEVPELEVRAEADPAFHPSRTGAAVFLEREAVHRVPSLSRNFVELAVLSPLVTVTEDGVSVTGQNHRFNSLQIDGALAQDVFGLSPSGVAGGRANARPLPLEAVEQFQVLAAPFDVRQSGFTGGVLNAVTRSGTNRWETSAFGFFRDEALMGELVVDEVPRKPEQVDDLHVGLTAAGPLVRDRVHFFAAGELERRRRPPAGFHVGVDDPFLTLIQPDSAARFRQIMGRLGADPGTFLPPTQENHLVNVFARLDARLSDRHRAVLRHNFSGASDEPPLGRLPGEPYEFTSAGTSVETASHSTVLQLLSDLGGGLSNDLLVNLQFLRDDVRPLADYPRVEVDITSRFVSELLTRRVRAGAALFAHANELDQDLVQVTNNLSWSTGAHRLLAGVSVERFGIDRRFLPGSLGSFRFANLAALEANVPQRYDAVVPLEGDGSSDFSVVQLAGWLQDEWSVGERLRLTGGLRLDVPFLPDTPAPNPEAAKLFGVRTDRMPSGLPVVSPRLGFNLRLDEGERTQLRGGVGLFTGRPPFAWLANAFQNNGLASTTLTCEGPAAPAFGPGEAPPTACRDGATTETAGRPTLNVFDPDFRFPQELKAALGVDRRLPFGFVGTAEAVYTRATRQIELQELNLLPPVVDPAPEDGFSEGFGFGNRDAFGEPTLAGFRPRRVSERFGSVVRIGNGTGNIAYGLNFELRRRFGDGVGLRAGYSFGRAADTQNLFSDDATTNLGLTPSEGDPNAPKRQPSLFDRPHKVVLSATGRVLERLGGTEVSVLYVGQSGRPYSYTYLDDVNGDGFPGDGRTLDLSNDLISVPFGTADVPGGLAARFIFQQLIVQEECLQSNRGRIVSRNACRTPWENRLDLRLAQDLRAGPGRVQVVFDLLNVLNFLDAGLGHVERAPEAVQVLRFGGRTAFPPIIEPDPTRPMTVQFTGPIHLNPETGGIRATLPHTPLVPESQWQAQFGIRVRF